MKKPFDNDADELEDEDSIEDTILDDSDSVTPPPALDESGQPIDPLQAALAVAESIVPNTSEYLADTNLQDDSIDDAASLKQVIDQVGKGIEPDIGQEDKDSLGIPEELDALDIRAELGRPDVSHETSRLLRVTEEALESDIPPPPAPMADEHDAVEVIDEPREVVESKDPELTRYEGLHIGGLRFGDESRWHGSLEEDALWHLLASAFLDKLSGAIVLEDSDIERKLFIHKGDVVVATSTARDDRLVELLYREGRLGDEEFHRASKTVGVSGRRVGAVLVERGLIASRELFPLVRHHYESIIYDSFPWRKGTWRYDPDATAGERILLEIKTPALILEGIRLQARPEDISELAPMSCNPLGLPTGLCKIEEAGLVPEEIDVYRTCDGVVSIEQLAQSYDIEKRELQKMVAGLVALGLIQSKAASSVEGTEDRISGGDVGFSSGVAMTRTRVLDKVNLIKEGSYFSILEVENTASGYEIRNAFRRLKAEFALERFAVTALADIQPQSEKIYEILDEAYEVLRDPTRRESYRQGIKEVV